MQFLSQYLDEVVGWERVKRLRLNPGKMQELCVSCSWIQEIAYLPAQDRVRNFLKEQPCS